MSSDRRQGNDGDRKDSLASEDGEDNEFEVEAILGKMTYRKAVRNFIMFSNGFNPECYENSEHCKYVFHVKWRGYDDSYNTWEVEENLANNITYMEYKKQHNMSEQVEKDSFSVKEYLIECYRNKRHPLSDEVLNHVKKNLLKFKPTIIRQSISRSSVLRPPRKSPVVVKEKKKKSDANMVDLFGDSPEQIKGNLNDSMADLFGKSPEHKRKSSEHNKSPPRKKPLSSSPSKETKERDAQQTPKRPGERKVSSIPEKAVSTNPGHSEKAFVLKTSSVIVEPPSTRTSTYGIRNEERKSTSQKGDSLVSDIKRNIDLKEGTTSRESRSADIDQTMKKDKIEKSRSSNSMWISAAEKERELERKRKIVEARETARLEGLDNLEVLENILKQKKKREPEATEQKHKKRDKSHDGPSTSSSSVDNLSFSRREKEHQKIRNEKKAAESSSIFSDTDLFDRGSEEAGSLKKAPVAAGISVTSRPVGNSKRFSDALTPVPIPKPQAVSERDRAKIKQLAAQRPVMGKAKTTIPNQRPKNKDLKSSMSLFNLPKIPKKVSASTTSSASEASMSKSPKKFVPPKASSSLFDVDDIMSSMDKTIKHVPSPLPSCSPATKPPPLLEKAPHLMLKSSQKPKREQKVPKFKYNPRPRLSEESYVPSSPTTDYPMPVTKKAHSTSELFNDDVMASTSEPIEPLATKAKGKEIQKPPRAVKDTTKVRVLRQLNQPFYSIYHTELFRKLGLLDQLHYSDDYLRISKWILEADAWSIYNNIVAKFFQRSKATKSNIMGMHVCMDGIRVLMNWDEKENVWKIFPGRASKRLMNAFAKKGVPTELGTKAAPPPFVFRVSREAIDAGKRRKLPPVDLEQLENNISSLSIHSLPATVKEEPADNKVGNPYNKEPLDGDHNSSNTNGMECLKIALCKILNQTSLNISDLVNAYKRLDSNRIEELLTPISSALNRFHIIRELVKCITPQMILAESSGNVWLFESELCQKNKWWEVGDVNCHQKSHGKCRMLKTLIQLLPEKLRFHSESPFNHGAFMHTFMYGSMCQKSVFFDAGAPLYLSDFEVNERSLDHSPFFIDHFLIVVCQGKPWQIIQMLLKGCCVNSLPWRRTFDNTEISTKEIEPASIRNLLSELLVNHCPVMAPSKAGTIYNALWIFSARLQSYVMEKVMNIVENHYEGLVYEAALTPVHTMRSVGPSQTANAFTCILHGTEENNRLWSNFCVEDDQAEEDDTEGLPTEWFNSLDVGTIREMQQDLGALVISVFRVNFTGGVVHNDESNSQTPLDVVAAENGSCTPLSIGLTAIGPTLSRPSISLENPEKVSKDEWVFKFGKDELAGLPALLDQRVLLSLDTDGPIGVKFLVQLHLLLQEE